METRLLVPKYSLIIPALLSSHSDWLSPSSMLQGSCLIGLVRAFFFSLSHHVWSPRKRGPHSSIDHTQAPVWLHSFLAHSADCRLPAVCLARWKGEKGRETHARWRRRLRKLRAPHASDCLISISTEPCRASSPLIKPPATSLPFCRSLSPPLHTRENCVKQRESEREKAKLANDGAAPACSS